MRDRCYDREVLFFRFFVLFCFAEALSLSLSRELSPIPFFAGLKLVFFFSFFSFFSLSDFAT